MTIESDDDLRGLRRAGMVVSETISEIRTRIRPGMTTAALDDIAAEIFRRHGARSAPNVTLGFPATICVSVNDETVHGIPGRRPIRAGDLVKVDVVASLDGYVADAAVSIPMPKANRTKHRLASCAHVALDAALAAAVAGVSLREMGRVIEESVRAHGFTVLKEVGGHGIGRTMHEPPHVPNWRDPSATTVLHEGLVLAVEPIVADGARGLREDADGWTLRTTDGSASAHWEHTIVITRGRPLVLTAA